MCEGERGRERARRVERAQYITMCSSTYMYSSATGAVKSSTRRRDSKDTFYSSDEDRPLVHHAHSSEGTGDREGEISSSDEGSSSEEDQREGEKEGGRSKIKGGRGGKVNNERGAGGRKSESESESESSSSSEEEERGVGGGGGKKLFMGQSRSKEKVNKIIKFGGLFNYKFSIINYTALPTGHFNSSQEVHECYSDEPLLLFSSQDSCCCSWLKQSHAT